MITTITVSTISTVSALVGVGTIIGWAAAVVLIAFLSVKVLAGASENKSHRLLSRSLDIGITPLLICFAFILATSIAQILSA